MISGALKVKQLRVYIAGPITLGDRTLNLRAAILAGDAVFKAGHLPYIPHLNDIWHLVCPHPAEEWYKMDEPWLALCDAVVRLPGESVGADSECKLARRLGIPIFSLESFLRLCKYVGKEEFDEGPETDPPRAA